MSWKEKEEEKRKTKENQNCEEFVKTFLFLFRTYS